ncbi:VPLPA-CTERM sorting domain-containing protein [Albimonas sp. CAU 1670]|uniref:VPLPA-CTERM sorting domain-containing protein n=1 Tax=Albimonas sp. CAU 1670 TaxID=3032599 RepID=UPI0023DBFE52|nr:VPLPA-CTERM sorting domain-containing protein [Albimonas sp. CAU 1670]MDF2232110.1 VPLPA-CTERM sorting domain-containing protein [Albimonas sp. CAU 1670]
MTLTLKCLGAVGACLLAAAQPAAASAVFTIQEVGADVVASWSGSLDTTTLTFSGSGTGTVGGMNPGTGTLVAQVGDFDSYVAPDWVSFGTGSLIFANSIEGVNFGMLDGADVSSVNELQIATGYVPGTSFSGSMTFLGATLAGLGLVAGSYVNTLENLETITVTILPSSNAAVPLPAAAPLLIGGVGALAFASRRRRSA